MPSGSALKVMHLALSVFIAVVSKSNCFSKMGQTISSNQALPRYFEERGPVSNLDRCLDLYSACYPEEATESARFAIPNTINLEPHHVRKNNSEPTAGTYLTFYFYLINVETL